MNDQFLGWTPLNSWEKYPLEFAEWHEIWRADVDILENKQMKQEQSIQSRKI